jgi:hypothetical protein
LPQSRSARLVIGLAEYIDIPAWRVAGLRAKVDTGARSSALHVENLEELANGYVRFDVRLHRLKPERRVTIEAPIVRRATVRSSSGVAARRIFVAARIVVGRTPIAIELGLVDRGRMLYRMLLGRMALARHFLVDPSARYLLTSSPRRRPKRAQKMQSRRVAP